MMIPRTRLAAVVRIVWLASCLLVLTYAWLNRGIPDTDEAVSWALIVITFPIALTLSTVGSGIFFLLYRFAGITVPGGFGFNVIFWLLSVGLGYWFWFVLIPRVAGHER